MFSTKKVTLANRTVVALAVINKVTSHIWKKIECEFSHMEITFKKANSKIFPSDDFVEVKMQGLQLQKRGFQKQKFFVTCDFNLRKQKHGDRWYLEGNAIYTFDYKKCSFYFSEGKIIGPTFDSDIETIDLLRKEFATV